MSNPLRWLFFDQPDGMAIGIADHHRLLEAQFGLRVLWNEHHVGADELRAGPAQALGSGPDVLGDECRLPMPEIAGPGVAGHRPAAGWRLVFEELDVGRGR